MQIGPRIRVGGTLGKIGEKVKKPLLIGGALALTGGLGGLAAFGSGGLGGGGGLGALSKLGALKKVAGSLMGGGGDPSQGGRFRNLVDLGKFGEGVYDRYQKNRQYKDARQAWDEAAPLRQAGQAGLLDTSRPDLSSVFADPMNPQGRYRRVDVGSRGGY